jgi:hypothetical protein
MTEIGSDTDVHRPASVHMGHDITAPEDALPEPGEAQPASTSTAGWIATSSAPQLPADASYVARFHDLPPLGAARSYGDRALESAAQAELETQQAQRAARNGDLVLARDMTDSAIRFANSAQFFEALMDSSLSGWVKTRPGRSITPELRKLQARVQAAVVTARSVTDEVDAFVRDRVGEPGQRPSFRHQA